MIDPKRIRQNPQEVASALEKRHFQLKLEDFLQQDTERRALLAKAEEKKALRNNANKSIGLLKKKGGSPAELQMLMTEIQQLSTEILQLDEAVQSLDLQMENWLMNLPNLPHASVAEGAEDVELRTSGTPRAFVWEPKSYQELLTDLHLTATYALPESEGVVYCGFAALLQRKVVNALLETCCVKGYTEISPLETHNAKLPLLLTLWKEKIFSACDLPIRLCAYSAPDQLTMTALATPEQSDHELEQMTVLIERFLLSIGLCTRVVSHCAPNLPFDACKCYRIECWLPSQQRYVEVARAAAQEDYLARQVPVRFREQAKDKPRHVCTTTGVVHIGDPLMSVIMENHQNEDGSVSIPVGL